MNNLILILIILPVILPLIGPCNKGHQESWADQALSQAAGRPLRGNPRPRRPGRDPPW